METDGSLPCHRQEEGRLGQNSPATERSHRADSSYLSIAFGQAEKSPGDGQPWARLTKAQRLQGVCLGLGWIFHGVMLNQ